jgi:hypothetical protein
MRIRMAETRTGPRWDGRQWPPVGGELDVDDDEGAAVCEHGWAVPADPADGAPDAREAPADMPPPPPPPEPAPEPEPLIPADAVPAGEAE